MTSPDWSEADERALRSALLDAVVEDAPLADPADVRRRGEELRRRRLVGRAAAAAAAVVLVAVAGALGLGSRPDALPPAVGPSTPSATGVSPSAAPDGTTDPTTSPAPGRTVTDTDVVGPDGTLGPFRLGMDRAAVERAAQEAGLDAEVRVEEQDLGGGFRRTVLVRDGADTDVGTDVIGLFDDGALAALVAPATARLGDHGVGEPVSAFEDAFPGRVSPDGSSGVYLLRLTDEVTVQLGRPQAFLDPSTVTAIVVLPAGAPPFPYFS